VRKACLNLMSAHGQNVSAAIVQRQVIGKCDELQFLKRALEAGGAPTREALLAGAYRLGSSWVSGMTFTTRFDARHHDGAASFRDFAWNESCSCFRYTSGLRPLP
jgi:hypothetical protein